MRSEREASDPILDGLWAQLGKMGWRGGRSWRATVPHTGVPLVVWAMGCSAEMAPSEPDPVAYLIQCMPIALLNEAVTDRQASWEWTDDGIARNRLQNPGYTPLMVAAVLAPRYVQGLLDRGADPHLRDGAGCTALMLACSHQPSSVSALLAVPGDLEATNARDWTALMFACKNHPKLIPALLEAGANVNHQNRTGWSALMVACWERPEAVGILVNAGASTTQVVNNYDTGQNVPCSPLVLAALRNPKALHPLLEAGFDPAPLVELRAEDRALSPHVGAIWSAWELRRQLTALPHIRRQPRSRL